MTFALSPHKVPNSTIVFLPFHARRKVSANIAVNPLAMGLVPTWSNLVAIIFTFYGNIIHYIFFCQRLSNSLGNSLCLATELNLILMIQHLSEVRFFQTHFWTCVFHRNAKGLKRRDVNRWVNLTRDTNVFLDNHVNYRTRQIQSTLMKSRCVCRVPMHYFPVYSLNPTSFIPALPIKDWPTAIPAASWSPI